MSTLSPTFTLARASVSCTLDEYFQPFGPVKVIDGTSGSMAVIVAVIVTCLALVPPGRTCSEPVVPLVAAHHVRLAGPLHPDDDVLVIPNVDLVADLELREPRDVRPGDGRHEGPVRFLESDRAGRGVDRLDGRPSPFSSLT